MSGHIRRLAGLYTALSAARGLHFPVILMSGSGDATLDHRAAELGCLKFLRKPFASKPLLEAIVQALSGA